MHHAIGGETGSGFGSYLLEEIRTEYGHKLSIQNNLLFPDVTRSSGSTVETYNAVLAIAGLVKNTSMSLVHTNKALSIICQYKMRIENPGITEYNHILARSTS